MINLVLVDSNNSVLGTASKELCHDGQGILHRAFSIFVFNKKGEMLLQKRASGKRLWPGYWSNSCCSHPFPEESNYDASSRRLMEEMGISSESMTEIYDFEYQANYLGLGSENELCFVMVCRSEDSLNLNSNEVSEARWVSLPDLELEIDSNPEQFTPWFILEIKELTSKYIQQIVEICSQ